jgi:hypothetical protein
MNHESSKPAMFPVPDIAIAASSACGRSHIAGLRIQATSLVSVVSTANNRTRIDAGIFGGAGGGLH